LFTAYETEQEMIRKEQQRINELRARKEAELEQALELQRQEVLRLHAQNAALEKLHSTLGSHSPSRVPSVRSPVANTVNTNTSPNPAPPRPPVAPVLVSTEVQTTRRRVTIEGKAESVTCSVKSTSARKRASTLAEERPNSESTATFVQRGITNALKDIFTQSPVSS
jgi:hypothetical protein